MKTHDVGRLFFGLIGLERGTPLFHRAPITEIEHPFRVSSTFIVRIWKWGLLFGIWHEGFADEAEALMFALGAEETSLFTEDGHLDPMYGRIGSR